ncbi:uncharacterized protein LOC135377144 isoform X1 [Ornithodoros turicata]|uniref:uncharacterized protein LOC135377144 isoform X1 n=1 Tax=Ornithodoros turicata TaxID=34597 RepID=UPI0031398181
MLGFLIDTYHKSDATRDLMREHIQRYIKEMNLDAVMFQTSQTYRLLRTVPELEGVVCYPRGPAMWTDLGEFWDQMTFVYTLEFMKSLRLPHNLRVLLAFSSAAYNNVYRPPTWKDDINIYPNRKCSTSNILHNAYEWNRRKCLEHTHIKKGIENSSMTYYYMYFTIQTTEIVMLDTNETFEMKICNAQRQYSYDGGYVLFDIVRGDVENLCGDTNFTDGFADAHYIKKFMHRSFKDCSVL